MSDETLLENNEILTVQDEDSFVGIYFNNGHFDIRFPLGYKQPDAIPAKEDIVEYKHYEKQRRKDILTLVKVLSANDAMLIANQEANSSIDNGNNFPFYAYNFVYKYYKKNGYYIPKEKIYKKSDSGKINWNRTIKQIKPVVSDKNIVYLETIRNKTNYNDNELIAIINRYCVYQSYLKVGCLFSSKMVKEEKLKVSIRACIKVLNRKIRETFNSDELNLFRNMKKILETENNDSTKNEYYFGTTSFHTIWEAMVNDFYGIPKFIRVKFNPTLGWRDSVGEKISGQNSTLRPDTIAFLDKEDTDRKIFILDSKYYKGSVNLDDGHLPLAESVPKQLVYAKWAVNKLGHKSENVFNAFIMPADLTNSEKAICKEKIKTEYFGFVKPKWLSDDEFRDIKSPYNRIQGIKIDTKDLMENYNKKNSSDFNYLLKIIEDETMNLAKY